MEMIAMNACSFTKLSLAAAFAAVLGTTTGSAFADAGHAHGATIGAAGKAAEATRTITIELRDVVFEPAAINVKAGETIRFVLKNTGSLLHEFNIGTAAMHAEHQKEMLKMQEMGMLSATSMNMNMNMNMDHSKMGMAPMKHDDPNSALVEPGKATELVWKFTKATKLEFACNIPGHYEAGMVGEFKFGR
jgi:uncharacterized cupredoxin-like copper-binding protein